ncbi:hypothetical protein SPHINGOAX6_70762 [Sphingomonas sp. AX6]|nr:hypothetical protein SPHINGOAX6_70762 [Sphingomonas sp. AX6]
MMYALKRCLHTFGVRPTHDLDEHLSQGARIGIAGPMHEPAIAALRGIEPYRLLDAFGPKQFNTRSLS